MAGLWRLWVQWQTGVPIEYYVGSEAVCRDGLARLSSMQHKPVQWWLMHGEHVVAEGGVS
jgi:hypothetical protein